LILCAGNESIYYFLFFRLGAGTDLSKHHLTFFVFYAIEAKVFAKICKKFRI